MRNLISTLRRKKALRARRIELRWPAALFLASLVSTFGFHFPSLGQESPEAQGGEVQTRGPVHEAFAGIVSFNAEAGVVVTKAPPDPVEEMPPEEKPEGDNVTWIPGYWAWDDERNEFLWISGTWRALPPGRAWVAGYWARTDAGYQWTSGYWVDAAQQEATYLPAPPATVEAGPNVPAPSPDYIWTPGCWMWTSGHYAWRPGYWVVGRPDWDWVPAHYVWTPSGYLFVGGYWDYPVERRGVLFAPVYFPPHVYAHQHFVYSPSIVIGLGVFSDHLFCRPRYHHYYFGDYYAPAYVGGGFYASFSFHIGHHGYDPIFAHHRWHHRHDHGWHHRLEASYRHRREHVDARPPRTWVQQRNVTINRTRVENNVVVASTYDQYRNRRDNPVRFQSVPREERQRLVQRTREVQTAREQRQSLELRAPTTSGARPERTRPVSARVPKTSIAAAPITDSRPGLTPPEAPRAPRVDSRVRPTREPERAQPRRGADREEARVSPSAPTAPAPSTPERNVETRPGRSTAPPQAERQLPARPQREQPQRGQQQQPEQRAPATRQPERQVAPAPAPAPAPQPQPSRPQPERQVPSRPQPPQERRAEPPQERRAEPPQERRAERRITPVPPQVQVPAARPQERRVPSRPSQEFQAPTAPQQRRTPAPQPEQRVAPPEMRRVPQNPAVRPQPPQRGRNQPQQSRNAAQSEKKGAEQLRER